MLERVRVLEALEFRAVDATFAGGEHVGGAEAQ
jgi:hypothetical protein